MIRCYAAIGAVGVALTLVAPTSTVASAKIIHVASVLAKEAVPNPPGGEDEAAGWHGKSDSRPMVIRLQQPATPPAAAPRVNAYCPQAATAPAASYAGSSDAVTAGTFYLPSDQMFGARIFYQKPAWDSDRFLQPTGWAGPPNLWDSHIR